MGYTDGTQAYLPCDGMLEEDGYEVVSFYEYRQPARFVKGIDETLRKALRELQERGRLAWQEKSLFNNKLCV